MMDYKDIQYFISYVSLSTGILKILTEIPAKKCVTSVLRKKAYYFVNV